MYNILIVDDEQDLREILSFNFESENFSVSVASNGEEALDVIRHAAVPFDIVLLDVMMQNLSGFEVASILRSEGNQVPIIFLTALADDESQLQGFGFGADDYISKPFSFTTVLARVRAVLKRSAAPTQPSLLVVGNLSFDLQNARVVVNGDEIVLTKKEFAILSLLLQPVGRYYLREQILDKVWGDDICVNDRSVDVHIARLRKKLGPEGVHIVNRTGFGYAYVI